MGLELDVNGNVHVKVNVNVSWVGMKGMEVC